MRWHICLLHTTLNDEDIATGLQGAVSTATSRQRRGDSEEITLTQYRQRWKGTQPLLMGDGPGMGREGRG